MFLRVLRRAGVVGKTGPIVLLPAWERSHDLRIAIVQAKVDLGIAAAGVGVWVGTGAGGDGPAGPAPLGDSPLR